MLQTNSTTWRLNVFSRIKPGKFGYAEGIWSWYLVRPFVSPTRALNSNSTHRHCDIHRYVQNRLFSSCMLTRRDRSSDTVWTLCQCQKSILFLPTVGSEIINPNSSEVWLRWCIDNEKTVIMVCIRFMLRCRTTLKYKNRTQDVWYNFEMWCSMQ